MNKEKQFTEQDAPAKNTDQAFVQVSQDGSPRIPEVSESRESTGEEERIDREEERPRQRPV